MIELSLIAIFSPHVPTWVHCKIGVNTSQPDGGGWVSGVVYEMISRIESRGLSINEARYDRP